MAQSTQDRVLARLEAMGKPSAGAGSGETFKWLAKAILPYHPKERTGPYDYTSLAKWVRGKDHSPVIEGAMTRWLATLDVPAPPPVAPVDSPPKAEEPPPKAEEPPMKRAVVPAHPVWVKHPNVFHHFFEVAHLCQLIRQFSDPEVAKAVMDTRTPFPADCIQGTGSPPGEGSNHLAEGYVYILQEIENGAATGYIKVGRVGNDAGGMPSGITRFNPRELRLVVSFRVKNASWVESNAQAALGQWHSTCEWFRMPLDLGNALFLAIMTVATTAMQK